MGGGSYLRVVLILRFYSSTLESNTQHLYQFSLSILLKTHTLFYDN